MEAKSTVDDSRAPTHRSKVIYIPRAGNHVKAEGREGRVNSMLCFGLGNVALKSSEKEREEISAGENPHST
jgi:hypothetical protein